MTTQPRMVFDRRRFKKRELTLFGTADGDAMARAVLEGSTQTPEPTHECHARLRRLDVWYVSSVGSAADVEKKIEFHRRNGRVAKSVPRKPRE